MIHCIMYLMKRYGSNNMNYTDLGVYVFLGVGFICLVGLIVGLYLYKRELNKYKKHPNIYIYGETIHKKDKK